MDSPLPLVKLKKKYYISKILLKGPYRLQTLRNFKNQKYVFVVIAAPRFDNSVFRELQNMECFFGNFFLEELFSQQSFNKETKDSKRLHCTSLVQYRVKTKY